MFGNTEQMSVFVLRGVNTSDLGRKNSRYLWVRLKYTFHGALFCKSWGYLALPGMIFKMRFKNQSIVGAIQMM